MVDIIVMSWGVIFEVLGGGCFDRGMGWFMVLRLFILFRDCFGFREGMSILVVLVVGLLVRFCSAFIGFVGI